MKSPAPQLARICRAVTCLAAAAAAVAVGTLRGSESERATANSAGNSGALFLEPAPASRMESTSSAQNVLTLPSYTVPMSSPAPSPLAEVLEWERDRMVREWAEQAAEPQAIYFPPAPPVLGAPLPSLGLFPDDVVRTLAPYVAEPFYAPLSTRVAEEDLGRRARARLEQYRDARAALLAQLREQLAAVRHDDVETRREKLRAFAELQTPAIEALEATAEALRRDFFRTRFLGGGGDWNQFRAWHLDPDSPRRDHPELRLREMRVLRAAVYYQEGLSPAQRRLLREVVMDQAATAHVAGAGLGLGPGESLRVVFFSPDTARLPLPPDLPADLAAELIAYSAAKETLKRELRDRLVALDGERNTTRRVRSLQDLAAEQSARCDALEEQAEAIRLRLAEVPGMVAPPAPPPLPGALEERVATYLRDKSELQRIAQEKLAAALADFDRTETERPGKSRAERRATVVRTTVDAFHAEHAARMNALQAEGEAIREALMRYTANRDGPAPAKSTDTLLREFGEAFRKQQLAGLYAEYRTAMLEPGLSPAQRRLLFNAAIADLKLPGAIRDQQVSSDETLSRP